MNIWGYSNISFVKNEITQDLVNVVKEGWISKKHPDFLWKYYKKLFAAISTLCRDEGCGVASPPHCPDGVRRTDCA